MTTSTCRESGGVIRKILAMALIGFLVVTLAGPVVTLLGLALVGFIVWNVFQAIFAGRPVEVERARSRLGRMCRGMFRLARFTALVMVREFAYLGRTLGRKGAWLSRAAWERARNDAPLVGGFMVEVVSGTAIGGSLGLVIGWRQPFLPAAIGIGAGAGAIAGILVGILNWRARRRLHASYS